MLYDVIADIVVAIHALLVVFFFIYPIVIVVYRKRFLAFVIFVVVTAISQAIASRCPMTIIENNLRHMGNHQELVYTGSCIAHYLNVWFGVSTPYAEMMVILLDAILFGMIILIVFLNLKYRKNNNVVSNE